jgi:hypothetical protein
MKPLAYLAVLAVSAALVGALPVQAEQNDSNLFAKLEADFASWQTEGTPWSDYGSDGNGEACCGDVGCGDGGCGGCGCGCCRTSGIIAGVEMSLLQAHYGACSIDLPNQGVQYPQCTPAFDHETTPRFWLGLESCDGLAFRIRYWQYDHSASAVDVGAGYYVDAGLQAEDLDFEVAQSGYFCNWEFEIAGGARWAKIADDLNINDGGTLASWARSFEGGGPTFALGVRRELGIGNLALVGNFRASLIYGDTYLALSDDVLDVTEDITATIDDHLVEIYEIQVGAEWSRMMCGGYRVAGRVVLEAQAWELAPGPGPLGLFDTNIGFVGPSFSLAIER